MRAELSNTCSIDVWHSERPFAHMYMHLPFYKGTYSTTLQAFSRLAISLYFHQLVVVCRYRDPQLQAGENYTYLFNLRQNIANR